MLLNVLIKERNTRPQTFLRTIFESIMCLSYTACSRYLISITETRDLSIPIPETRMHTKADSAYLKHLVTTPDAVIPACAPIWNIVTPSTHPDVLYLGWKALFLTSLNHCNALRAPKLSK